MYNKLYFPQLTLYIKINYARREQYMNIYKSITLSSSVAAIVHSSKIYS